MNIYIMDGLNGITDIIDSFRSVIWNVQYYGVNDFELIIAGNVKNLNRLTVGKLLVLEGDFSGGKYENVMIIETRELSFSVDEGWLLTVRGAGLKNILSRRIVWNQTNLTGKVEPIIRQVITDNIIDPIVPERQIDDFILDAEQGFSDEIQNTESDNQLSGDNIAEWMESICKTYSIGWDVYIDNGKYVFKLYKGEDRSFNQNVNTPVVFSPEYDNLTNSKYTYDVTEYKNSGIVAGEGEGSAQAVVSVGDASGLDRFEMYIDGSSVSSNGEIITQQTYLKMLTDYGNSELKATQALEKVEGEVVANGLYKINHDYYLGDLVQIVNEYNISAETRIIEVIFSEDENGSTLVPTFSDWSDDD